MRLAVLTLGFLLTSVPLFAASTAKPDAATAAAPNANPASQSLLDRLPDPRQWEKSPLEHVVKDVDPITKDPDFKRMGVAIQRHDGRALVAALRTLTNRYPDKYAPLHNLRGAVALSLKFNSEADGEFRRVTAIEPKSPVGWYGLAWAKILQNNLRDAAVNAQQSVKASPSFAPGWMLLAACQTRLGKPADALASDTRATQVAPNSAGTWIALAQCKIQQNKAASAVGDLEHARGIQSDNFSANALLGTCYIQLNQPAKAVSPYEQALKKAPNNVFVCRQLGYCYLATGQTAAAESICRKAVKLQPKYAAGWDMLGTCYRREGKNREAIDAFQHAVNEAPRDLNARTHLDEAKLNAVPTRA